MLHAILGRLSIGRQSFRFVEEPSNDFDRMYPPLFFFQPKPNPVIAVIKKKKNNIIPVVLWTFLVSLNNFAWPFLLSGSFNNIYSQLH